MQIVWSSCKPIKTLRLFTGSINQRTKKLKITMEELQGSKNQGDCLLIEPLLVQFWS